MPCCPAGCDMMWQDWQGRGGWHVTDCGLKLTREETGGLNIGVFGVQNQNQYLIHIFGQFCFLLAISIFLNSPIDINIYQKFLLDINIFVTLNFLNTDIPNTPSWKVDKEGGDWSVLLRPSQRILSTGLEKCTLKIEQGETWRGCVTIKWQVVDFLQKSWWVITTSIRSYTLIFHRICLHKFFFANQVIKATGDVTSWCWQTEESVLK